MESECCGASELLECSESELLKIKNFGRKSFEEIIYKLRKWRENNEG